MARRSRRQRRAEVEQFHADLVRYQAMVKARRFAAHPHDSDAGPDEEELRQGLLRREGAIRPAFQRVKGQPFVGMYGQAFDVWEYALHDHGLANHYYFVQELADHINTYIGMLHANLALLDPPKPSYKPIKIGQPVQQSINIYGPIQGGTFAQTAAGDVYQAPTPELTKQVLEALTSLREAVNELHAPDDERAMLAEPVAQLEQELARPQPRRTRVALAWKAVQGFATLQGVWAGWEHVQNAANGLTPLVEQWLRAWPK